MNPLPIFPAECAACQNLLILLMTLHGSQVHKAHNGHDHSCLCVPALYPDGGILAFVSKTYLVPCLLPWSLGIVFHLLTQRLSEHEAENNEYLPSR